MLPSLAHFYIFVNTQKSQPQLAAGLLFWLIKYRQNKNHSKPCSAIFLNYKYRLPTEHLRKLGCWDRKWSIFHYPATNEKSRNKRYLPGRRHNIGFHFRLAGNVVYFSHWTIYITILEICVMGHTPIMNSFIRVSIVEILWAQLDIKHIMFFYLKLLSTLLSSKVLIKWPH